VAFHADASPFERDLVTTDPLFLASIAAPDDDAEVLIDPDTDVGAVIDTDPASGFGAVA
jgi:hypothetical protein